MTSAELVVRYRGYAAQCLIVARRQDNPDDKLVLIDMAQAWATLAEFMEKSESLFVLYETPEPKPTDGA